MFKNFIENINHLYYTQILTEANILDVKPLEKQLEKLFSLEEIDTKTTLWAQTFIKKYIKYYLSSEDDSKKSLKPYKYREGDPEWARTAQNLMIIDTLNSQEYQKLQEIIHFVNAQNDEYKKKLYKKNWQDIESEYEQWKKKIESADRETKGRLLFYRLKFGVDYKEVQMPKNNHPEYMWIELITQKGYEIYGSLLSNCLGTHYTPKPNLHVFVLVNRDAHSVAHVAIALLQKKVREIKGKANSVVQAKFRSLVKDFLLWIQEKFEAVIDTPDIQNMDPDILYYNGNYYYPDSKAWKELQKNLEQIRQQIYQKIQQKIIVTS